jgi:hypothetical protein
MAMIGMGILSREADILGQKARPGEAAGMTVKSALRSDQQVDVLLITQDLELKNRLVQIFLEKNHFALRTFNGTIFEVEDFLQTSKLPEILIADLNMARFLILRR